MNNEYQKQYRQSEKGKAAIKKYQQSEKGKATQKRFRDSEGYASYNSNSCKGYRRTKKGKITAAKNHKLYRQDHPEHYYANVQLNNAIRDGKLTKEPCEFCNIDYNIEGHHHDYNQPLNIMWLCRHCHRILHGVTK